MNLYKCTHCNKILERDSDKKWIPSICSNVGKRVRLQLLNQNESQSDSNINQKFNKDEK